MAYPQFFIFFPMEYPHLHLGSYLAGGFKPSEKMKVNCGPVTTNQKWPVLVDCTPLPTRGTPIPWPSFEGEDRPQAIAAFRQVAQHEEQTSLRGHRVAEKAGISIDYP